MAHNWPDVPSQPRGDSPGRITPQIVEVAELTIELRVDPRLAPTVLRAFAGTTPTDAEVDALPLPGTLSLVGIAVRVLRWYRMKVSVRLGQRCVLEPTCSRYAELAFRRHGLLKGVRMTVIRLRRCRAGNGGINIP